MLILAIVWNLGCTPPAVAVDLPSASVRVHLMQSSDPSLDVQRSDWNELRGQYFGFINKVFVQAGMQWEIDRVVGNKIENTVVIERAMSGGFPGGKALAKNVDMARHMAPNGWDMYLVSQTGRLGFGGAYVCAVQEETGRGAIFVPMFDKTGAPIQKRKWAHEFGHSMGLSHTPCREEFADNLMMSGSCDLAKDDRTGLNAVQISRIRAQRERGGPVRCDADKSDGHLR